MPVLHQQDDVGEAGKAFPVDKQVKPKPKASESWLGALIAGGRRKPGTGCPPRLGLVLRNTESREKLKEPEWGQKGPRIPCRGQNRELWVDREPGHLRGLCQALPRALFLTAQSQDWVQGPGSPKP